MVWGVEPTAAVLLATFGLLVGSFLNVVIARLPAGQSLVHPRSRCPKCGHQLAWFENIPVFSWMVLRGRCQSCRAPISARYPMVELLTALLFLACFSRYCISEPLVGAVLLVSLLIPLTFIDLEHWILPFSLTLPGITAGLATSFFAGGIWGLIDSALGAAAGFLGFWAMELLGRKIFKKEALGGGDKYLLAMIGAFLSYRPLLAVVFLASIQGAVVGSALLLTRGRAGSAPPPSLPEDLFPGPSEETPALGRLKQEEEEWKPGPTNMPFGPWLALGALEILLLGDRLADWVPQPLGSFFTGRV